jgi:16S rRNA (cytosine1402-N4)-methyltransferase
MRMDLRLSQTAGDVVNTFSEKELSDIFYHYGDVRHPNRVVRAIVHDRKEKPFTTTRELAGLIERVDGVKRVRGKTISSATQYFMALRIAVNGELDALKSFLAAMPSRLNDGGRCAVISFHSLEDRIVKHTFREWSHSIGSLVNKKIIEASEDEVRDNPRARSAKLRVFQKGGEA